MNKFILILMMALMALSLNAKTITKRVSGFGINKQKAITNALVEAISQVKGVKIETIERMRSHFIEKSSVHNKKDDDYSYASDENVGAVLKITKGIVQSYDLIEVSKVDRGYEAVLDVQISIYKAPGLSHKNRRKIAIMPFYSAQNSFILGGKVFYSNKVSDKITQALTSVFTQSRKFAVLDRTYTDNMASELNMINSSATPLSEQVKFGQRLGADYILVGTVQKAEVHHESTRNQSLGTTDSKNIAEFIIDYRIILVGTSQIKWSDTAKARIDMKKNSSVDMAVQDAVERVSESIATSLLSNIYPIRIAQITKLRQIVLNQGGNSLHVGMRMNVMHQGEKIIDPYTKESLGRTESKIATIEITQVTAKMSYAKVVEGSVNNLHVNDICRRDSTSTSSVSTTVADNPNWKKSNVSVSKGGGVKLGF